MAHEFRPNARARVVSHERVDYPDGSHDTYRTSKWILVHAYHVPMAEDKLLVEYRDGTLEAVNLRDIRMHVQDEPCPYCNSNMLPIRQTGSNSVTIAGGEIRFNVMFGEGTTLKDGTEVRKASYSAPINYCPMCGRKLV